MMKYNVKKSNGEVIDVIRLLWYDCPVVREHHKDKVTQYVKDFDFEEEGIREQVMLNLETVVDILVKEVRTYENFKQPLKDLFLLKDYCGRSMAECRDALSLTETIGEAAVELMKIESPLVMYKADEKEWRYPTLAEVFNALFKEVSEK